MPRLPAVLPALVALAAVAASAQPSYRVGPPLFAISNRGARVSPTALYAPYAVLAAAAVAAVVYAFARRRAHSS